MNISDRRHQPLLQGRLVFFGRRLLRGRARLFDTHIELRGWSTGGLVRRKIPLATINDVSVDGAIENQRLYLRLGGDTAYTLLQFARGASLWKVNILNLRPELGKVSALPLQTAWNSETRSLLSEAPESQIDKRQVLRRVDDISKPTGTSGTGGGGHSADHSSLQFPSTAAN